MANDMERVTVYMNNVQSLERKAPPAIYQINFPTVHGNNVVALINGFRGHVISRMLTSLDCSSSSFLTLKTRTTKNKAVNNACSNERNTKERQMGAQVWFIF